MKRTLLSGSLIIFFILYGLQQRETASTSLGGTLPIALATQTPVAPTPDTAPSATPTPTPLPVTPPLVTVTPLPTLLATPTPSPTPSPLPTPQGRYKNGTYTGSDADAYYGTVQVSVTINGGAIRSVTFLKYPNDRPRSTNINLQAIPYLQQEAITAQTAQVDTVSGATYTTQAFNESLAYALNQAK